MKKHEWREKTEDGEVRLVTATRHAGKWALQACLKSEDEWTEKKPIPLEDLESLLEIITNKYRRNRRSAQSCSGNPKTDRQSHLITNTKAEQPELCQSQAKIDICNRGKPIRTETARNANRFGHMKSDKTRNADLEVSTPGIQPPVHLTAKWTSCHQY